MTLSGKKWAIQFTNATPQVVRREFTSGEQIEMRKGICASQGYVDSRNRGALLQLRSKKAGSESLPETFPH